MNAKQWGLILALLVVVAAFGAAGALAARKLFKKRLKSGSRSKEPVTVIGDVDDPFLVISRIPEFSQDAVPLEETPEALVQHLLEVFVDATPMDGDGAPRDLRIELSPTLQAHLASGNYESMVQRAAKGGMHVVERDRAAKRMLRELERIEPVNAGLMATSVWQLAAALTAQKYLFEIRGQLDTLRRELRSVRSWFENHYAAKMEADFRHVQSIATVFLDPAAEEDDLRVYAQTLEDVARETRQLMSLQLRRLDRLLLEVQNHDWSPGWTVVGLVAASQRAADFEERYGRAAMAYLFAARTRLIAAALRGQFGLDRRHAARLIRELETELTSFTELHRDPIPAELLRTAGVIGARIARKVTKEGVDRDLRAKLKQVNDQVIEEADEVARAARLIVGRLEEPMPRLALEVRVDPAAKKVVEVRQLP